MRDVKTTFFIEEIKTNGSFPCKFGCNDGTTYFVKHSNYGYRTRQLSNEWIIGHLSRIVGLPISDFSIVTIMDEVIDHRIRFSGGRPKGLGFGSKLLSGRLQN